MDLNSGYPFWPVKNGLIAAFPRLQTNLVVDALVIGGGITGAIIASHLKKAGLSIAVAEKRDIGWGSTSASTAMLQYEIDTELHALSQRYGLEDAATAYLACAAAVGKTLTLARGFKGVEAFPLKSLYYASRWWHEKRLRKEFELRREIGLTVHLVEREKLKRKYGLDAPIGILSDTAATIDPYQLTYALFKRLGRAGVAIHDNTAMTDYKVGRTGVQVSFDTGATVRCKHLILACGYETQNYLDQSVASNRSSYAYITDTQEGDLGALATAMMWESSRPYLYLRRTKDRRLVVGGEDDSIDIPIKRDQKLGKKTKKLRESVEKLLPKQSWEPAYAWAGTFAETEDGLPFFGPHKEHGPRVHFAMAYGGNGITYSLIGAEILSSQLRGKSHELARLFSFKRLS